MPAGASLSLFIANLTATLLNGSLAGALLRDHSVYFREVLSLCYDGGAECKPSPTPPPLDAQRRSVLGISFRAGAEALLPPLACTPELPSSYPR